MEIPKRLEGYDFKQAKFHSSRRGAEVDLVVLHYTAGGSNEDGLANFFAGGSRKASAHFGVGRTGRSKQMVELDRNAWHPGNSRFMGKAGIGNRSIGIEICNRGWAYLDKLPEERIYRGRHRNKASSSKRWEKYSWQQVEAVDRLLRELKAAIPTLRYVTGHEDIRCAGNVPGLTASKTDPGPALPWLALPFESIGLEHWSWSYRDKSWYHVPEGENPEH